MELNKQIKKHRAIMNLSQEEFAEKIYVTRQTVSNWENEKSYPDIHSLLLMSSLFGVSLDQLIKGDLEIMKNEIKKEDIQAFSNYGKIFTLLFIASIVSAVPLAYFGGWYGFAAWWVLFAVTLIYSFKVEKLKKQNNIQTYKEIIAFSNGEQLDEISQRVERAKNPYQKVMLVIGSALFALVVCGLLLVVCILLSKLFH